MIDFLRRFYRHGFFWTPQSDFASLGDCDDVCHNFNLVAQGGGGFLAQWGAGSALGFLALGDAAAGRILDQLDRHRLAVLHDDPVTDLNLIEIPGVLAHIQGSQLTTLALEGDRRFSRSTACTVAVTVVTSPISSSGPVATDGGGGAG